MIHSHSSIFMEVKQIVILDILLYIWINVESSSGDHENY